MKRAYIYKGFERLWHWLQALLIITLAVTGFEIHGTYTLLRFETAVRVHNVALWAFIILIVFAIFWHITTGQWKQYLPRRDDSRLGDMVHYYTKGMFQNEKNPSRKTELSKLNPLQRFVYLGFKILIVPVMVTTGLLYYFYSDLPFLAGNLNAIAWLHTVGAFTLVTFFLVHVYMTTTGRTASSNIKAMVTGWEDLETPEEMPVGALSTD